MKIDDKIRDEKLKYDVKRKAGKISALSSEKSYKHEYLTGEEILPADQRRVIEQNKFTYFPLGKALENWAKAIKDERNRHIKEIEDYGKQLVESDALVKKMIMILKVNFFWRKKIYMIKLLLKEVMK